jgi:hypothetical protein
MPETRTASRRTKTAAPSRARGSAAPRRSAAPPEIVAVDIGNSDTVVGTFRGRDLVGFWRLTSRRMTGDEIGLELAALMRTASRDATIKPSGAVLCSVVPVLTQPWAVALERVTGRPPIEVGLATVKDLAIRYHDRTAVGADRIANAIAVRALYGTPRSWSTSAPRSRSTACRRAAPTSAA